MDDPASEPPADPVTADTTPSSARPEVVEEEIAPPVVVVMVARDPGPWFEDALAAVAGQSYPSCTLLVVDAASTLPLEDRVALGAPGAHVVRLDEATGFAAAANAGAEAVQGAAFLVFCHDDVRFEPDVVQQLVEESFRSNAAVVGPKLVAWRHADRLLAVGMGADKVAAPAPMVEHLELDQEQHDAVDDVFFVPTATVLVRADLFDAVGGFDPAFGGTGADLEFCWRAHVAGARVLVAPIARVAHYEAAAERAAGGDADVVRRRTAAQVRTVALAYGRWHRARVRPQLSLLLLAELVVSLATARFAHAKAIAGGWRDGRRSLKDRRQRRQLVERIRKVPDRDIRHLQVRGFARLRGEVLGRRAEDRDALATASSGEVVASARGGSAVTAWVLAIAFLVLGSRAWLTDAIPVVGEFVRFPGDPATLFEAWTSRSREVGVGTVGPSPTANGALALASALTFGSTGLLRQLLILATLPVGAIGMWRLCRPVGSRRARVVGLFAYLATPVLVNAMAWGRWGALVTYALAPWGIAVLARASRAAPFGPLGGDRGPGVPERPLVHHVIGLGIVTALASLIAPVSIVVVVGIGVALAIGGLLGGRAAGWWRLPVTAVGAGVVAGVLLGPWTLGFVQRPLDQLVGASSVAGGGAPGTTVDLAALVRFDTGPVEVGIAGYGLLAAAALALLIGKSWRLVWAVRCWTVALAAWGVVWAAANGWITPFPAPELPLAVAAAALAFAAALGMAAFEVDLPDYHFGWRQVVAVVAGAGFFVFLLPALAATVDGGWRLPTSDFATTIDQLDERTDGPFRVLWLGDPAVLPLNGWEVPGTDGAPVAFGVSYDGPPSVEDLYPRPGTGTDLLADAVAEALAGDSSRLGAALGPMGIRYVVVPDRRGPAPGVGEAEAARPEVLGALDDQLDLARVEGNPALVVYQNAAWSPVRSLLAADADGSTIPPDAATALRFRDGYADFSGSIDDPATVYLAADADPGWVLDVGGAPAPQSTVQGWSMLLRPSGTGDATLSYETPPAYLGGLAAQVVAWAVAILVLLRIRVVVDERRRRARTPEEELAELEAATAPPADVEVGR